MNHSSSDIVGTITEKIYSKAKSECRPFHYKEMIETVMSENKISKPADYSTNTDVIENVRNRMAYTDLRFCRHGGGIFCLTEWHFNTIQLSLVDDVEFQKNVVKKNHEIIKVPYELTKSLNKNIFEKYKT